MLDWLLSYAAHSTLLLGAAWLLASRTRSHLVREALWKTALFGAFFTATAQTALGVRPLSGSVVVAPAQAAFPSSKSKDFEPSSEVSAYSALSASSPPSGPSRWSPARNGVTL